MTWILFYWFPATWVARAERSRRPNLRRIKNWIKSFNCSKKCTICDLKIVQCYFFSAACNVQSPPVLVCEWQHHESREKIASMHFRSCANFLIFFVECGFRAIFVELWNFLRLTRHGAEGKNRSRATVKKNLNGAVEKLYKGDRQPKFGKTKGELYEPLKGLNF